MKKKEQIETEKKGQIESFRVRIPLKSELFKNDKMLSISTRMIPKFKRKITLKKEKKICTNMKVVNIDQLLIFGVPFHTPILADISHLKSLFQLLISTI